MIKTLSIMSGCYAPPHREVTLFKHAEIIHQLPDVFLKMLISHTPVHHNLSKYYDIILYDKNNVADPERQFSFGAAESMLIRQGLIMSNYYGIEWMFKLGFDCLPEDIFRIYDWIGKLDNKYMMVSMTHGDIGVGTLAFLMNVKWGLNYFPEFKTIDEMFDGQPGKHLEFAVGEHLQKNGQLDKVFKYENGVNTMFSQPMGVIDYRDDCQGVKQDENLLARYKA